MSDRVCSTCGSRIPANIRGGHCPRCLLQQALESDAPIQELGSNDTTLHASVRPGSVLDTIRATTGAVPCVLLRDTDIGEEPSPVIHPTSGHDTSTRYRIDGEIARGGMGAVLKGRDPDIGRDVAIKVLREDLRDNGDLVHRFVEEAQIGGQLQHPGVVPIYELGTFADKRPFFSMKLVKGQTLTDLLEARSTPADDLPRFLSIFASMAQTMAYAHTRGVIHRDLKPSNVMVGSFGEVQVMDWGLAKVLARGGRVNDAKAGKEIPPEALIATARSGSELDLSRPGSTMGTPSYMAPEQARGDTKLINERADVFALGSILCEILTGSPAFTGRDSNEILRKSARGDTADALLRLAGSGAESELIALARACLAVEPRDRPHDANGVSERITAYLAGAQERVQAAERERAVAVARAIEERRRRRVQLALAASIMATALLGGGGWAWITTQHQNRLAATARRVDESLLAATNAAVEARNAPAADLAVAKWTEARAAARQAQALLADGEADETLRHRVEAALFEIDRGESDANKRAEQVAKDRALVARLEEVRARNADQKGEDLRDKGYREAFLGVGLDVDALPVAEAARWITERSVAVELAAALDDWAAARRRDFTMRERAQRLLDIARAADPDPWRDRLRDAIARNDRRTLNALADLDHTGQSAQSLVLLGTGLAGANELGRAEAILREGQRRRPGDFWLNYTLADVLARFDSPRDDEVIRFLSNAVATRPASILAHNDLGLALATANRTEECLAELREAIRLWPENRALGTSLAYVLHLRQQLEAAIALKREAIAANPKDPNLYYELADSLFDAYQFEAAIETCQKALRIKPDYGRAHTWLGRSLAALGRLDEALPELRLGIGLEPGAQSSHIYYGVALRLSGRLPQAVAALKHSIEIQPYAQNAMNYLGDSVNDLGQIDEACQWYARSLELKPVRDEARHAMLLALLEVGETAKAEDVLRAAEKAVPKRAIIPHLGGLLRLARGEPEAAVELLQQARRTQPEGYRPVKELKEQIDRASRLAPLAAKLPAVVERREWAVDEFESAELAELALGRGRYSASARLFRDAFTRRPALADDSRTGRRNRAALAAIGAGLGIDADRPEDGETDRSAWRRQGLEWLRADLAAWQAVADPASGGSLQDRNRMVRTLRLWKRHRDLAGVRDADALGKLPEPERAAWRTFWALVDARLRGAADGPAQDYRAETMALVQEAIRQFPLSAAAQASLLGELVKQGKIEEARTALRAAVKARPDDPAPYRSFGHAMSVERNYSEAVTAWREVVRLAPDDNDAWKELGISFQFLGRFVESAEAHRKAARLSPGSPGAALYLAFSLLRIGQDEEALTTLRRAAERSKALQGSNFYQVGLKEAERRIALLPRLPAVIRGEDRPRDDAERLTLARMCASRQFHAAAARLFAEINETSAKLAKDGTDSYRFEAACAAAQAAMGQGKDDPPPDDEAKTKLRSQALKWLKAERDARARLLNSDPAQARALLANSLPLWKANRDLAPIRDPDALAKLPQEERQSWQAFWRDVDDLLKRAER
jgi:serine/threonine-protein kinase